MKRRVAEKKVNKAVEFTDLYLSMIQLKIMDVAPPVVDFYTRCLSIQSESLSPQCSRMIRTLEATL